MARKTLGKRRFFTRRPTKDSLKIDHAHETTPPVPHAMNTASPDREKPLHTATRMLASAWAGLTSAIARLDGRPTGTAVLSRPRPLHLRELEPQVTARRRSDATEPLNFPGHENTTGEAITLPPLALKTHQDALTGLASREYLNDNAEGLVAALRAGGTEACILRIGVDGLDAVTQRYGAHAADQVLQQVAKRLRHLARERDIVMRLHGAEFALLVACPGQEAAAGEARARELIPGMVIHHDPSVRSCGRRRDDRARDRGSATRSEPYAFARRVENAVSASRGPAPGSRGRRDRAVASPGRRPATPCS
jgi:diguanylate cyclase (GGDEF)-like protein